MFNQIITAIDNCVQKKRQFINCETAYIRDSPWPFDKNVTFQIFRDRTTTRHDINKFYLNSINKLEKVIIAVE